MYHMLPPSFLRCSFPSGYCLSRTHAAHIYSNILSDVRCVWRQVQLLYTRYVHMYMSVWDHLWSLLNVMQQLIHQPLQTNLPITRSCPEQTVWASTLDPRSRATGRSDPTAATKCEGSPSPLKPQRRSVTELTYSFAEHTTTHIRTHTHTHTHTHTTHTQTHTHHTHKHTHTYTYVRVFVRAMFICVCVFTTPTQRLYYS